MSRPNHELLTAWVLLLLDGRDSHGYDLSRRIADAYLVVQPSALYRRLRVLEGEGSVASHWATSVGGPPRRVYELTREGRRDLDEIVERIRAIRDSMNVLLESQSCQGRPAQGGGSDRP